MLIVLTLKDIIGLVIFGIFALLILYVYVADYFYTRKRNKRNED